MANQDYNSEDWDKASKELEEEFSNPKTLVFPNVTKEEISLYIKVVKEHGREVFPKGQHTTVEEILESKDPLTDFLALVAQASFQSPEFQQHMYGMKQILHLINRSTGLANAYLTGVAVGYFLAKPEMMPMSKEEGKGEN